MIRLSIMMASALSFAPVARAQMPFDPATVAYVLCVTGEIRKFALEIPAMSKDQVIDEAFTACGDAEVQNRKSLFEQGMSATLIDDRLVQLKKFVRQTAEGDIDRVRANVRPR